jgi:enoyl-CoA hydratase/carnithine racemase
MTDTLITTLHPTQNGRHIGVIMLNAARSLNALTLPMIRAMHTALRDWADDPSVVAVLLQGAGEKAFCAGGDVVSLRSAILEGRFEQCEAFFGEEYALDLAIHTYEKPILCWGAGIVMGGGKGLMVGASHRVVTETSRFAMPEISIGLFPDVGGSWFLNRMPGRVGVFLGLTGVSFNAADALFLGMADVALPAARRATLLDDLARIDWTHEAAANHRALSRFLREASRAQPAVLAPSAVREHFDTIQALTDADTVPELVKQITAYDGDDAWLKGGAQKLAAGCPMSAWLVVEAQRRARTMSLAQVFEMERMIALECCRRPDLPEGVRALLVDKDQQPHWCHASVADVPWAEVAAHFAGLPSTH